jgi:alkanesulfonate monooxygenase SsuD/methylene tetrahydromethanopterin reductase-like flavin-dependent oxidoreductase (luciferase family)
VKIGIGLPAAIAGVSRDTLLNWAQLAEARGFSSLGAIDRIVFPNLDPLTALTAAAAVTERISLCTCILLGPLRSNHAQFAREIATMEVLSEGRVILGLGVGSRADDFEVSGVPFERRGREFTAMLETATAIWRGEHGAVGPPPPRPGGPPLYFGGESKAAIARAVRFGTGWFAGGGRVDGFRDQVGVIRQAFDEAGREAPKIMKLGYFALGDDAKQHSTNFFSAYYGPRGPERLQQALAGCFTTPEAITAALEQFRDAQCDEVVLMPTNPDSAQVERLADLLGIG